ncbi:cation:proton antiporter [Kitasatospora sp. NPDC097643]|uniref:cation:proton antiporter domain-containing protein n=1 Tax=Kitasatospora sp. NPDC097643 TaxID=3157230 RepID=UPI0033311D59
MPAYDPLPDLLKAVPVVILTCRAGARLLRRVGQPPVVGEVVAGIALGPSLLGWLAPGVQHALLPHAVLPFLTSMGNLGLLAFMFLLGLELDLGTVRRSRGTAVSVSLASLLLPLALGAAVAVPMYNGVEHGQRSQLAFTLFIAVAMGITAFPVLARILTDRGMQHTPIGTLVLTCAAVDDIVAWCLLALVAAVSTDSDPQKALLTGVLTVAFAAAMILLVKPLLARLAARFERPAGAALMVVFFSGICLSALATDRIGVHAIFGAFLFGVVAPRGYAPLEHAATQLRAFAVPVLLPMFFVGTGLNTDFSKLAADPTLWGWAAALLVVAVVGKWGGSSLAARATGESWRDSLTIGALMNCRGLTELVVLNVGMQLGVITPEIFSVLVLITVITTAAAAPAVDLLQRDRRRPQPPTPEPAAAPLAHQNS